MTKMTMNLYRYPIQDDFDLDLSLFYEYEIQEQELDLEHRPMISMDAPAFFFLRMDEREEELWEYLDYLRRRKWDIILIVFREQPDEAFWMRTIRHRADVVIPGKPQDYSKELSERITAMLERMRMLIKAKRNLMRYDEIHFEKRQKIMAELLSSALHSPDALEARLKEVNERYHVHIDNRNFMVLVISCNRQELISDNQKFLKEITLLVIHNMEICKEIICNRRDPYGLVVVMNLPDHYSEFYLHKELMLLYMAIKSLEKEYGEFDLSIGVGPRVERIREIARSLTEASMAQEYRMFSDDRILYATSIPQVNRNWYQYISAAKVNELSRYVALSDTTAVSAWFEEFREHIEPSFEQYPPAFARICWECYNFCLDLGDIFSNHQFLQKKFLSLQNIFNGYERVEMLEKLLLEVCHLLSTQNYREQDLAPRAIAYMKVHFDMPISLEVLAENCGVSTSYFSRKFKEETGQKYIDALTDIRIQEAQQLLEHSSDTVAVIMEKVGYLDDKHFRRVFLKRTGMTPTQYRKKYKTF